MIHNRPYCLKRNYFLAVIDGVFCLDARVILYKCETLSVITIEWSEIMGTYNTPESKHYSERWED